MSLVRSLLVLACLAVCLAPGLHAGSGATTNAGTEVDEMLVIMLEHHWVFEVGGQRFGLIQFDTPMTTVLLGRFYVDLPVPAIAVVVSVAAIPLLAAAGAVLHGRRRRCGFYA